MRELEDAKAKLETQATQLLQQSHELTRARDTAVHASRLKSEFLASVSHEIRSSMNGIVGMTSLLLDSELNADQREYADTVRRSADFLLEIINGILDFSRIEAGKIEIETVSFDIRAVLQDVMESVAERADDKGLELACYLPPQVPENLIGDPGRVRQVLSNLVVNAVKFTPKGDVLVTASVQEQAESSLVMRFEVRDTGIGVGQEAQQRLFQPFYQDNASARRHEGTGLGLAICRHLVELMGGEIGFESHPERGSVFWFCVQFDIPRVATPSGLPKLSGVRVLVVDDSEMQRRTLVRRLADVGATTVEAADGPAAIIAIRHASDDGKPFHTALIDLHMPGMDGLELARALTVDRSGPLLVLMTSFTERGSIQTAPEAGISACIAKPLGDWYLLQTLRSVIDQSADTTRSIDNLAQKAGRSVSPSSKQPRGHVLIAEDNIVNQKVAVRLVEKAGYRADVAGNGLEVLEAVTQRNYGLILMDCQMPEMDGFEATRKLRERRDYLATIPIIAMTANAMQGDRERCIETGMNDYIAKPVSIDELTALLDRWCRPLVDSGSPVTV
jgi:CheY-like chemotaxis protein/nitrogen-specific signal transduction histidine kinase